MTTLVLIGVIAILVLYLLAVVFATLIIRMDNFHAERGEIPTETDEEWSARQW